jgi:hypothetical protein
MVVRNVRQWIASMAGRIATPGRRLFLFRAITISCFAAFAQLILVRSAMATPTPNMACGGDIITLDGLTIAHSVICEMDRHWEWRLEKTVDDTHPVLSPNQQYPVTYTVSAIAEPRGVFEVTGQIRVKNVTEQTLNLMSTVSSLGVVTCSVNFPYQLAPGDALTCLVHRRLDAQPAESLVEVVQDGGHATRLVIPLDWPQASSVDTDECITISDSFASDLGSLCIDQTTETVFRYTRDLGPFQACGVYSVPNTATFKTNDTAASGSDVQTVEVTVPCESACTLPSGYWKVHSASGPDAYDQTWDAFAGGDAQFLLTGKTYIEVMALEGSADNAFYALAQAYISAELNQHHGAQAPAKVKTAFNQAQKLLTRYAAAKAITNQVDQSLARHLAETLDSFNSGAIGPGGCSQRP